MKTWFLIAAVVLSVSLLPATVSAKDEVKTMTLAQCTKGCQGTMDVCRSHIGNKNFPGASEASCKEKLNICLSDFCGLKAGATSSKVPGPAGSPKK